MLFKTNGLLTPENILDKISPLDIFKKYSKHFNKPDSKFKAEFRKDPLPSAIIYEYNETFLYKDFGEDGALNCFQFTGRKYGLNFNQVLSKINEDFFLELSGGSDNFNINHQQKVFPKTEREVHNYKTIIEVKRRDFTTKDLIWWNNQSWTFDMLKLAKISPISHFRLTSERKNIDKKLFMCGDYSYVMDYYWNKDIYRRKLYFPKKKSYQKWISNVDNTIVQGWDLLPKKGELLFITSSLKDCGPFYRVYNKWCAIAPNNEGSFIPEKVFLKIKQRFKYIIIYFDNDDTGIKKAKEFSEIYNIPYMHNPIGSEKDPAAWWKLDDGLEFTNYLKNNLITL